MSMRPGEHAVKIERTLPRISPRDFQDYAVQLRADDRLFIGGLGNISEKGMCVIVAGSARFDKEGLLADASIRSAQLDAPLEVAGRLVWWAPTELSGEAHTLIGVEFEKPIELPASLFALGMSAVED